MTRTRTKDMPGWVQSLLIFTIGVACFFFILVNRQPIPLRPMALQVRYGFTFFVSAAILIFSLIFRINSFWGRLLSFTAILSLFALGLSGLWASSQTERQVIGGLLPSVDAGEYYYNALRLLNGSNFFDFGSRRPIFPSFFTTLLWISNKDMQLAIGMMVLIVAICTYLAFSSIRKHFHPSVSAIFLILVYLFYRRFSGVIMSENLGFALGLLSFSLLMDGLLEQKPKLAYFSVFLTSYALNVRAGAFFIIPLLLLGLFCVNGKKLQVKRISFLIGLALTGFLFSFFLFKVLGSATGIPFSNFAHTLYGLAQGGKGWAQIYFDHPEIFSYGEAELSARIYQLAFSTIKTNPWNLIAGLLKQYGDFFNFADSNLSVFSYVTGENIVVYFLVQIFLYLLSAIGICHAYRHRDNSFLYILLFILCGIMLSVPFITSDASRMRAYAPSIAFIIIFPVIGLSALINKTLFAPNTFSQFSIANLHPAVSLVLATVILFSVLAFIPRFAVPAKAFNEQSCPLGQENIIVNLAPGTYLKIHPESEVFLDWVPNIHELKFKTAYISYSPDVLRDEIKQLPSSAVIFSTINLLNNIDLFLVIDDNNMFDKFGTFSICGNWGVSTSLQSTSRYFFAKTLKKIH